MMNQEILNSLVSQLEQKKQSFLQKLTADIERHISSQSTEKCLGLRVTSVSGNGVETVWYPAWNPDELVPYVQRLISFLLKKNYQENGKNYKVDSVLTNEIVEIISQKYANFYEQNQSLISDHIILYIVSEKQIANCLFETIVKNNSATKFASDQIQKNLKDFLLHSLNINLQEISSNLSHSAMAIIQKAISSPIVTSIASKLSLIIGKVAATSIAKTIGTILIKKITIYISHYIGIVTAKMMAIPAIKAFITKFVIAAVAAGFVKMIAVSTGASIGTILTFILVPVLIGLIIKEWVDLPKKLAKEISTSLNSELGSNFSKTNNQLISGLFEQFIGDQGKTLGLSIAQDAELTKQLSTLVPMIGKLIN